MKEMIKLIKKKTHTQKLQISASKQQTKDSKDTLKAETIDVTETTTSKLGEEAILRAL